MKAGNHVGDCRHRTTMMASMMASRMGTNTKTHVKTSLPPILGHMQTHRVLLQSLHPLFFSTCIPKKTFPFLFVVISLISYFPPTQQILPAPHLFLFHSLHPLLINCKVLLLFSLMECIPSAHTSSLETDLQVLVTVI